MKTVLTDDEIRAQVPDAFPLRAIEVPREITAVAGCDCGGLQWHRAAAGRDPGCSIWKVPYEAAMAAVDDALRRQQVFTAGLNEQMRRRSL